jgi:putative ABC transport system permease protein
MFINPLRKTPLAWLQVFKEKTRLAVALAGIAFADFLMFTQLGFRDALFDASVQPHYILNTDLVMINPQFSTLFAVKSFSRERIYQALRVEGIASIHPLYIGSAAWRNPENQVERPILVFGADPNHQSFTLEAITSQMDSLKKLNHVLYDQAGRPEYGAIKTLLQTSNPLSVQLEKKEVKVTGIFSLGASFAADGNVISSDSTFLNIFRGRQAHEVDVGMIKLKPDANPEQVKAQLQSLFPEKEIRVFTRGEFARREKDYWANSTAIGFIFNLGVTVGFVVGVVIVYQILYSDVSDHLPEYATLKAMGYQDRYLVGVLLQEAIILGVLAFIPGFAISWGVYHLAQGATMLPIRMTLERAITVFILTLIMCLGSGAIALNKLRKADPADIY